MSGWLVSEPPPGRRRRPVRGDMAAEAALLALAVARRRRRTQNVAPDGAGPTGEVVPASAQTRGRKGRTQTLAVLATTLLAMVLVLVAGYAAGWRSHDMTTPSMGRSAPVGTMVVSRPAEVRQLHVGEIIVFHPPGEPGTTFAHRVVALVHLPTGPGVETKGDINAARDPWVVQQEDLVGRVVTRLPDGGFVVQALPWLLVGTFLLLRLTSGARRSTRLSLRIGGFALLVSVLVAWFRPLERITLLSQSISRGRGVAIVVPTGVLPLRVRAPGGTHADLTPGQVGLVQLHHIAVHSLFRILSGPHLSGWWWLLLLFWAAPLLAALAVRREPSPTLE